MTVQRPPESMIQPSPGGSLINVGDRVLVTTTNWFYGPDGREYRAVFGTVRAVKSDEETLGIKTNRNATNWYAEVGNMTIAGCQIHYVVRCSAPPPAEAESWSSHEGQTMRSMRPSAVYNADAVCSVPCDAIPKHDWEPLGDPLPNEFEPTLETGWQRCRICGTRTHYTRERQP